MTAFEQGNYLLGSAGVAAMLGEQTLTVLTLGQASNANQCLRNSKGLSSVGDYLFGQRGGLLNSNDYVRMGWGWRKLGNSPTEEVFRIAIGNKKAPIHWHIDLW